MNHLDKVTTTWHYALTHPGLFNSALIVAVTLTLYFVKAFTFRRLGARAERTSAWWQSALLNGASLPLTLYLFALGTTWLAQANASLWGMKIESVCLIRQVLTVIAIAWGLMRFCAEAQEGYVKQNSEADVTLLMALSQLSRAAIVILSGIVVLQMYHIPISGVLAFGGVGAAAVALAAKDLLGNFFGSLIIYLDRPFKVGDWIRSPEKAIEGIVENIGWRLTRIRTFEKRPLYVPNGVFANIIVENPSRMLKRRLNTDVGLRYDDAPKLRAVIEDIRTMLAEHDKVDQNESINVHFNEFAACALNIHISLHTTTTQRKAFLDIQEDIFFKIIDIIDSHGAECAFPTTTVHVPNDINVKR